MTHPTSPPPPPGPRAVPNDPADMRKLAAELAGARGHSAGPLHPRRRLRNYWGQGGVEGKALTPKQRRRADHKASRYAVKTSANNRPGAGAVCVDVAAPAHTAA